jgi:hypothetical protein
MVISGENIIKKVFCLILLVFSSFNIQALEQDIDQPLERQDLFVSTFFESIGYSFSTIAYGGGLSIGSGSRTAIGMRLFYAVNPEDFIFVEMLFLLRYYILESQPTTGPFLQFIAGPVIYAYETPELSGFGNISAGLSAGWRFPFGDRFFVEPAVRVGYPYIAGVGVFLGVKQIAGSR